MTVTDVAELERAIRSLGAAPNAALIVMTDTVAILHHGRIIELTAELRLPAIYPFKLFASAGGLMSYGVDIVEEFSRAGPYADRILRGESPSNLPVQQPTKFELAVNLKTARAFGIETPQNLARAGRRSH